MKETGISRTLYFRILKENAADTLVRSANNRVSGGRPRILSNTDVRHILRNVIKLRQILPNWTAKRLMVEAGIRNVSVRTVRRVLNAMGHFYLQALKKGLMSEKDREKRVKFAKRMMREYDDKVWTEKVAFYFDGVNFTYKLNPKDQALAPRGRI